VTPNDPNPCRDAALEYAKRRWRIIPIRAGSKAPLLKDWPHAASADPEIIRSWWAAHPDAGVGILCGGGGPIVLDCDRHGKADGVVSLDGLGIDLSAAPRTRTGGGGLHYYYAAPDGGHVAKKPALLPGVDLQAEASYVVAPPSVHPNGTPYAWEVLPEEYDPLPALPPEIVALLDGEPAADYEAREREGIEAEGQEAGGVLVEGKRNAGLCRVAGSLRRAGLDESAVVAALREHNRAHCKPRLPDAEVERIARSIGRYLPKPNDGDSPHQTELGLAVRFVAQQGSNLRFCHRWSAWLHWDGRRWARDETGKVGRRIKATVRAIWQEEVESAADKEEGAALRKFALRCESEHTIRAALKLAESEATVAAAHDVFDKDQWAFNCLNGTLDLRTGELRPHRPDDMITMLAPVAYDPEARLDLWDSFLTTATNGDADLAGFLARAVGYSLTGSTVEEVLFFVYGPAASGKSTFLESVKATMGDYAATLDFASLLVSGGGNKGPRNDIARLQGRRLVGSIEVSEGRRLAEGLVKVLTGGDTVTARFLYAEDFEFQPAFKLWLAANDRPRVRSNDTALWRRILTVPFDHSIPKPGRDPAVKATLRDPKRAGAAILAWAVRGCLAWQHEHLGIPPAVERATDAYRESADPVADFLEDACQVGPLWTVGKGELRGVYESWCKANGFKPLSGRQFPAALAAHGIADAWEHERRVWRGIALRPEREHANTMPTP
jgi:putative DNA primase/helicase